MNDLKYKLHRLAGKASRWIFPEHCPVCDRLIPLNREYCSCSGKRESRAISKDFCPHCAHERINCVCNKSNTVYLPSVTAVYIYGGGIRADILNLKFNNKKYLAFKLGKAMAERCANVYFDVDFDTVAFVPMTESSYNERGYNQSSLLAEQVGKSLFLPVEDLFVKTRQTKAQHSLGGCERLENVKNSVTIKADACVKGKNILICDDVKTTGATLGQCVTALEAAGAGKVCCICAAVSDF